jgi:hypothetical protein
MQDTLLINERGDFDWEAYRAAEAAAIAALNEKRPRDSIEVPERDFFALSRRNCSVVAIDPSINFELRIADWDGSTVSLDALREFDLEDDDRSAEEIRRESRIAALMAIREERQALRDARFRMAVSRAHLMTADEIAAADAEYERQMAENRARERAHFSTSDPDMPPTDFVPPSNTPQPDLIQTSADFVREFTPPDYLVDGMLQRRFCYSATARTGEGKTAIAMRIAAHVATGRSLGNLEVGKGSVLYFAGENPTDIQMRWLGLTQAMGLDPAAADVHFLSGAFPLSEIAERVTAEIDRKGLRPALVVVDTSAAYNFGDDENSNAQAASHARQLRSLTMLPGGPCVIVLCHPTKRAGDDDLIPRGGGAFLAEVDGNLAIRKADSLVVVTAQGKFRGPEFSPLSFELATVTHPRLRDTRGRNVPTVIARPVDDAGKTQLEISTRHDEDEVLKAIYRAPGSSLSDIARQIGWLLRGGAPHHMKVKRAAITLQKEKMVEEHRGGWRLTQKGQRELNDMDRHTADATSQPIIPVGPTTE